LIEIKFHSPFYLIFLPLPYLRLCILDVSPQLLESTINKNKVAFPYQSKVAKQHSAKNLHSAAKKKRSREREDRQVLQALKLQNSAQVIHTPLKPINLGKRKQNEKDNNKNRKWR